MIVVSVWFQEFLKLTDFAESGSVKDKLLWAFRIYDKDRSGEDSRELGGFSVLTGKYQGTSLSRRWWRYSALSTPWRASTK